MLASNHRLCNVYRTTVVEDGKSGVRETRPDRVRDDIRFVNEFTVSESEPDIKTS